MSDVAPLLAEIRAGTVRPLYLAWGEEYLVRREADALVEALVPGALALDPEQLERRRATIRAFEAVTAEDLRTALRFAEVAGTSRDEAEEALGVLAMWVRDVAVVPFAGATLFHPELRSLATTAAARLDEDRLHLRFRLLDEALVAIQKRNASPRLQMERLALEMVEAARP